MRGDGPEIGSEEIFATRSPHVRGDGPFGGDMLDKYREFSPRAWGWSELRPQSPKGRDVLPTCVGMVRRSPFNRRDQYRSPHVRGDGPACVSLSARLMKFSPRAWGWSGANAPSGFGAGVLPTCVGMVRLNRRGTKAQSRSPHVRGDGPKSSRGTCCHDPFSPRAWGWSEIGKANDYSDAVLPTCVGMVRPRSNRPNRRRSSPHVRGDGPKSSRGTCCHDPFSPRAWGWSALPRSSRAAQPVLPTCVGMVRQHSELDLG